MGNICNYSFNLLALYFIFLGLLVEYLIQAVQFRLQLTCQGVLLLLKHKIRSACDHGIQTVAHLACVFNKPFSHFDHYKNRKEKADEGKSQD